MKSDYLNPMRLVRSSCLEVMNIATSVGINREKIKIAADTIAIQYNEKIKDSLVDHSVDWDAGGYHYYADVDTNGPLTIQCKYTLIIIL